MRTLATILFDEGHSEAWTIRPEVAAAINPSHPADSSYARAAELLRARPGGGGARRRLDAAAVLVIAHPSDPNRVICRFPGAPRPDHRRRRCT